MYTSSLDAWDLLPEYRDFLAALETPRHTISTRSPLPCWHPEPYRTHEPGLPADERSHQVVSGTWRPIEEIYTIGVLEELAAPGDEMAFWPADFLSHAYPVALGLGGDPIVQVKRGVHEGVILLTDHNSNEDWWAILTQDEEAAEDLEDFEEELEAVGFTDFAHMSTDQFVEFFTPARPTFDGAFVKLADSFGEFYALLCHHYGCVHR